MITVPGAHICDLYERLFSGPLSDVDIRLRSLLKDHYPGHILTVVPQSNSNLLRFAAAGHARACIDQDPEASVRFRGYNRLPEAGKGFMTEAPRFAKYYYHVKGEEFVVYVVQVDDYTLQYILKEPGSGELAKSSHSQATDTLLVAIGEWSRPPPVTHDIVYVYDGQWIGSTELFKQVGKASWDDVILDPEMKAAVMSIVKKFFDSRATYDQLGVPWYRGIMFAGPPGNGKTVSVKALMHALRHRSPPVPSLYVKAAPGRGHMREVFEFARQLAPCMLVLEDIDTIVTSATRSYFFNELDGLEDNSGILTVGTTNHLDRLDAGLSKRPSRFDRKYMFSLPVAAERAAYCRFWCGNLAGSGAAVDFPERLCEPMAGVTDGFSFAYMKECFVSTLLALAQHHSDDAPATGGGGNGGDDDGPEQYELWREFRAQAKVLRENMETTESSDKWAARDFSNGWDTPPARPRRGRRYGETDLIQLDDGTSAVLPPPAAGRDAAGLRESVDFAPPGHVRVELAPRGMHRGAGAPPIAHQEGGGSPGSECWGDAIGGLVLWPDAVLMGGDGEGQGPGPESPSA